jgi:hypothetical protein
MTVEQPTPPGSHEFVTTLRHFQDCNERLLRELRRQTQAAFTTRHELDDTRRRLDDTRHQLDDTRHQLDGVERALRHVRDSRSYHLLQRVLGPRDGLRRHCLRRLWQVGSVGTRLGLEVKARVAGKTSPAIQPVAAPELPIPSAPAACPHHDHQALYEQWIAVNEPDEAALERQRRTRLARNPLVSLVVPVNRTPLAFLLAMVESVHAQTYPHWELCLADGGSADPILRSVLESYCNQSDRIRVRFLETNRGIAGNTNAALELATGEYVGFLDHDDTLAPFALFEVARALNLYPDADLLYSDEDKIDETGLRRFAPFFKPAWSRVGCGAAASAATWPDPSPST